MNNTIVKTRNQIIDSSPDDNHTNIYMVCITSNICSTIIKQKLSQKSEFAVYYQNRKQIYTIEFSREGNSRV